LAARIAIVCALVAGAFLAIFLGFVARGSAAAPCYHSNYTLPVEVLTANASIPKGTSGAVIGSSSLVSGKPIARDECVGDRLVALNGVRGEVTIRTIPAGAELTAADFALRGPIHYPSGFPKRVPASQIPAKMSLMVGPPRDGLDLELAPGVWVDGSTADAAIDEHVANGTLVGYCASIRAFQARNPDVPFATRCWRT
jgi:hypothetical protein